MTYEPTSCTVRGYAYHYCRAAGLPETQALGISRRAMEAWDAERHPDSIADPLTANALSAIHDAIAAHAEVVA